MVDAVEGRLEVDADYEVGHSFLLGELHHIQQFMSTDPIFLSLEYAFC